MLALYASRRPGRPLSDRYTLSGIAVYGQPDCGALLAGRPVSGTPRQQFWCKQCRRTFVDARRLDDWAGDWAVRTLADPAHADPIEQATREHEAALPTLTAEAAGIESTLTEIAGRPGRQEMSLARHDAITGPLDARLVAIEQELDGLTAEAETVLPSSARTILARDADWVGWLEQWTEGTVADRRAMVRGRG